MAPAIPTNLADQLKRDEGERLLPYPDQFNHKTIGVGINLDANRRIAEAVIGRPITDEEGITQQESDLLLAYFIDRASAGVYELMSWTKALDDIRQAALFNMAFNMGAEDLATFHQFLGFLRARQYEQAAADLFGTKWASDVGKDIDPPGRATRIARQIQYGTWQ